MPERLQDPKSIPVPAGTAPLDVTIALVEMLCVEYQGEVTDVDVTDAHEASFIVSIPASTARTPAASTDAP